MLAQLQRAAREAGELGGRQRVRGGRSEVTKNLRKDIIAKERRDSGEGGGLGNQHSLKHRPLMPLPD